MLLEKWLLTIQKSTTLSEATLYMFGNNSFGQLGNNSTTFLSSPVLIGTSSWTQVSVGNSHTIALRGDRTMWAWGYNNLGQLGNSDRSLINRSAPVQIGTSSWISISTNTDTNYAVRSDGSLFAWGLNLAGQMGNNQAISTWTRYSWTSLASGSTTSTGRDSTGALWAWGGGNNGNIGDGTTISKSSPVQLGTSSWSVVGSQKAVRADGRLFTWGYLLGNNSIVTTSSPIAVGSLFTGPFQTAYASNTGKTMASWTVITSKGGIRDDSSLWLWGTNSYGDIGDGTTIDKSSPVQIGTSSWTALSSNGNGVTLAIKIDGTLWSWGRNDNGALGLNDVAHRSSPVQITSVAGSWTNVFAGVASVTGSSMARRSDGALYMWGNNTYGNLGDSTTINKSNPVQIIASGVGTSITSYNATAVIRSDGALLTWGFNPAGQLGLNDLISRSSPVQVGTSSWSVIAANQSNMAAIRSDGGLFTWGAGVSWGLAIGTTINRSSPVQVTSLNTAALQQAYITAKGVTPTLSWTVITGAFMSQADTTGATFGIKSDGSLWGWGSGAGGWLGLGDTLNRSSPTQIGTSSWSSIGAGYSFVGAIRSDGALFTWGNAANTGSLGLNDTVHRSSPVQVGTNSWSVVTASWQNMSGIRSDGTLWSWGLGTTGELGDNTLISKSSPVQLGSATNWTRISNYGAAVTNSLALNSLGQLYAWGTNSSGALGLGDTLNRSSPVQIGTSSWSQVAAGWIMGTAIRSDGALFTWGNNAQGQLGLSDFVHRSSPVQVGTLSWTNVSAGVTVSAIRNDNYLFVWGYGAQYQVGQGSTANVSSPVIIITEGSGYSTAPAVGTPSPNTWRYVGRQNAGIDSNGNGFIWGPNGSGQIGLLDTVTQRIVPTFIRTGQIYDSWTQVSTQFDGSLAVRSDNTLWAWGSNGNGVLGLSVGVWTSMQLVGTRSWNNVVAGYNSVTSALSPDNQLWMWGLGTSGQFGNDTVISRSSPGIVAASYTRDSWNFIGSSTDTQGLIRSDGALFMFPGYTVPGTNFGQWGDGTAGTGITRSAPVQLPVFNTSWISIVGGGSTSSKSNAGIKSDGSLWVWGNNSYGQVGDGTTINKSSPVQIGTSSYVSVSTGDATLAITSAGILWTWGRNNFGQLGTNDVILRSSPSQIGSSSWVAVAASYGGQAAIRSDGGLFTWGYNISGGLGTGDTLNRSSPVQLGSGIWNKISTAGVTTYAINGLGSLFSWGDNNQGALGDGTTINRSSPVQIGTSSWTQIAAGGSGTGFFASAIRKDTGLFTWGRNNLGQLGLNNTTDLSSPVQVGTSSWSMISNAQNPFTGSAIRIDGRLFTWGDNSTAALGDGTTVNKSSPVQIGTSSWVSVASGGIGILQASGFTSNSPVSARGTFYTVPGGQLYSWGDNSSGQLGIYNDQNKSSPVQLGVSSWTSVSSGNSYAMAIRADGQLFGWGINSSLQLGDNTSINRSNPVQVSVINNPQYVNLSWTQVAAGSGQTLALDSNGAVWGFGGGGGGVMGQNNQNAVSGPIVISSLYSYANEAAYSVSASKTRLSWTSIAVGNGQSLAVKDNKLFSWGGNTNGQLGDNSTVHRSSPVQVGTSSWTQVAAGTSFSAAIRSDGGMFTWGNAQQGNLGLNETVTHRSSPVQVGTSSWTSVSIGNLNGQYVLALRSGGTMWAWGGNGLGQMGDGTTVNRSSPVQLGTSTWTSISAGPFGGGAIRNDGALFAWGAVPGTPDNTSIAKSSPVQIGTSSWTSVGMGYTNGFAIKSDSTLWGWGYGQYGQLGVNSTASLSSPVQISTLSTAVIQAAYLTAASKTGFSWTQVASGQGTNGGMSMAIRNDGRLFTWGTNQQGQLGTGDTVQRFSPVQIGTSSWTQISVGQSFAMAIRNDGGLFTWGQAQALGNNEAGNRSSPVQVGTSSWTAICAGGYPAVGPSAMAIRSGGSLFTWGRNDFGQLGNLTITAVNSPIQIGTSSWTSLGSSNSGSAYMQMAIRSDGGLFSWGYNLYGQLGLNDQVHRSSPVQIGTSSWTTMTAGADSVAAIRSDGALFSWGYNTNGAVGDATTAHRSSPVLIGTSSWTIVNSFVYNTGKHAIRSDGTLWAWGTGLNYTLGNSVTSSQIQSPVQITTGVPAGSTWTRISAGGLGALAVDNTGQLYTWGLSNNGENGQRAFGIVSLSNVTFLQSVNDSWIFVNGGNQTTAAVRSDGAMFTWGENTGGQLGIGTTVGHRSYPVQVGTANSWSSVVASSNLMAITSASQGRGLFTWGLNTWGQLGELTQVTASSPIFLRSMNDSWTMIANSQASNAYGVRVDGTLWTWGSNTWGNLGLGDTLSRSQPTQVGTSTSWSAVYSSTASTGPTFAIDNTGLAWAWGYNGNGEAALTNNPTSVAGSWLISRSSPVQLGATPFSASPTQIGTSSWTSVSAGTSHALAVRSGGSLFAWGVNDNQQVGDNSNISKSSPVQIGTSSWNSVSAGDVHSLAIANNNSLWGWGLRYQPFVYNSTISPNNFLLTQDNLSWSQLQTGQSNSIALRSDGAMFVWGQASGGALNLPDVQTQLFSPTQVGTSSWTFVMNRGSQYGGAAIRSDGALFAWGSVVPNNTSSINYSSPVQIGTSSWTSIGLLAASALRIDRSLFTWGPNSSGELGDGTTIDRSSPVQIGTSSWTFVGYGFAIRLDGGLFSWGYNAYGTQGQGDTIRRSSPTQVGTSSWTMVAAYGSSNDIAGAIRSDGGLFMWGYGTGGSLGLNDQLHRSSPVQVGTSSWTMVNVPQTALAAPTGAIRSDGSLFTWGNTVTGDNTIIYRSSPVQIGTSSWTTISSGQYGAQALRLDKSLWAWGNGQGGGVGGAVYATLTLSGLRSSPVQLPSYQNVPGRISTLAWNRISSGYSHSVGVLTDGKLYGFGNMAAGNFTPYSWSQISAASSAAGAIRSDGALFMWGNNANGTLGQNNTGTFTTLSQVGQSSWTQISVGGADQGVAQSLAIRSDGTLWAWGYNSLGTLGLNDTANRSSPVQVGTSTWTSVQAGAYNSLGLLSNGVIYGWGQNSNGEVGDGTTVQRNSPVAISSGGSWTMISIKQRSALAISTTGAMWGWGINQVGQLGTGDIISRSNPIQIGTSSWSMVSAGLNTSAALRSDSSLWVWGDNFYGELGQSDTIHRSSPVQVTSLGVNEVSNSYYFATTGQIQFQWSKQRTNSFIRNDGTLWNYGSVTGDGTTLNRLSLVQIGTSSWTSLGTNSAIRSDGTLWFWNTSTNSIAASGVNGDGTTIGRSSPVQVSTGGSWSQVAGATSVASALRSDGTLWTWGYGFNGALGANDLVHRSNPVQIGVSSWTQLAMNSISTGAIRTDGALFTWGYNNSGGLGLNDQVHRSSPVQVGTSSWIAIASAGLFQGFLAVRSDGSLFSWGEATGGILGDNTIIRRSSPVQIGTSSWTAIATSSGTSYAIRQDGALFSWGTNTSGEVGDGTLTNRSSPVQIGTSSWTQLGAAGNYAFKSTNALYGWPSVPLPGPPSGASSPVFITANTNDSWTVASSGYNFNSGLRKDGMVFTWGFNSFYGMIGDSTTINKSAPVQIGPNSSTPWVVNSTNGLYAGIGSIYVINNFPGRSIFAWGNNTQYMLGQNQITGGSDQTHRSSPVQIGTYANLVPPTLINSPSQIGTSSWSQVSAEFNNTLAISSAGSVFEWGYNSNRPVAGITSLGISANTVSFNQISAGLNAFGVIKPGA